MHSLKSSFSIKLKLAKNTITILMCDEAEVNASADLKQATGYLF